MAILYRRIYLIIIKKIKINQKLKKIKKKIWKEKKVRSKFRKEYKEDEIINIKNMKNQFRKSTKKYILSKKDNLLNILRQTIIGINTGKYKYKTNILMHQL